MGKKADIYFSVDPWKIIESGFDPEYSRVSESVFSLGNETMGVRGFFDEGGSCDSLRGAYTNGVYDIEPLSRSYRGIIDKTHFMIPSAEWLMTKITLDGETLDLGKVNFKDFNRVLDMRRGVMTRSFVWTTKTGKELYLCFTRFLSMTHRERACQRIEFEALNFSGSVEISSGLSFNVTHEGYGKCYWRDVRKAKNANGIMLKACTTRSEQEVFAGALIDLPECAEASEDDKSIALSCALPLEKGKKAIADKRVVILFDGSKGEELWQRGLAMLDESGKASFDVSLAEQEAYWEEYWKTSDIEIEAAEGEEDSVSAEQQGIHFCSFQLAQTYSGGSIRHNIGAKGLTGEAYNGHAFWDTEACCLPFYLFTNPKAARDLLMFRYNTLPMARNRARMLDCKGACYPIATLSGDEACSLWQHASLQLQPSTAVAYGIWHYMRLTDDRAFLWSCGAEMLLEISRFLASRAACGNETKKYGFYGVMGPDEFHLMVNNNAYTNYMGMRTLLYTAEVLAQMEKEEPEAYAKLKEKTSLKEDETARWKEIADNMYMPKTEDGLFEQHDGYFNLPHTDINSIPVSEFPLYEHWSYDRIYRTDMIKQPDVLMMLYLYNSSFSAEVKRVNYDFYCERTIHESSLSPAIHSILAAELGKTDEAVDFFGYATRLDLDNYNRNTREGLHITSIAMAWANIVYGFAGMRSDGELLKFAPLMPKRWKRLSFSVMYKGRVIKIRMDNEKTAFLLAQGKPLPLIIYDKEYTLGKDELLIES